MSKVNIWTQSDYFLAFSRYEFLRKLDGESLKDIVELAGLKGNYSERFDGIVDAWLAGKSFNENTLAGVLEVRAAHE